MIAEEALAWTGEAEANVAMDLDGFLSGLPKAELHMHIEGSLEPEMMFTLARRNRISIPFKDAAEVRAAYRFSRLQDFLDIYYQGAAVLLTEEDFRDLGLAYFARAAADGVVHAEIFFDPQTHLHRGLPMQVVMEGLLSAMDAAERVHGVTSRLILCFLRHLPEEDAFETLRSVEAVESYPALYSLLGELYMRREQYEKAALSFRKAIDTKIPKLQYCCDNCGSPAPEWAGRCPGCGSWSTLNFDIYGRCRF